jgi:hypothetical protein
MLRLRRRNLAFIAKAIVCGGLLLTGSFAFARPQPQGRSVNLSAGKAAEAFKVPQAAWSNINNFVFLIAFDRRQPGVINVEYAKRFSQLASYPRLEAISKKWGQETFGLLQDVARELSKNEIKTLLTLLNNSFVTRKTDPRAAQREFDQSFNQLNRIFIRLADLTNRATQQAKELNTAGQAAIQEYRSRNFPENEWITIGPKLSDAQQALALMNGQWGALTSDLKDLQGLMANNKLDDIDVEVGLLTWEDITRSAQGFLADIPAQRKYLSGENYYDNCPLREDGYYTMTNSFQASANAVLTFAGDRLKMMSAAPAPRAEQQWRFRRIGQGWWAVSNRSKGDSLRLDVWNDGAGFPARLAPTGNLSGQYWRCMTTQAGGWVRLINAFNGEFRSLDTYSNTLEAFMAATENRTGQYWRFTPVAK